MRLFLPALAVVVGLANALLYNAFGNSPWGGPFVWRLQLGPMFTAHMLSAVLVGLIVSGALLLLAERKLRGSFFTRWGIMMVAFCAGGASLGVFLHASNILLDYREPMPQGFEILYDVAIPTVAGGILGSIEGAHLGLPLAWLLGMFGDRTAARTGSR
ncbi:MAG TPA: hypothetical protein VGV91_11435 [Rubrobacter sp.]|nr:hypothetical protein [Rubrobacter sp.]